MKKFSEAVDRRLTFLFLITLLAVLCVAAVAPVAIDARRRSEKAVVKSAVDGEVMQKLSAAVAYAYGHSFSTSLQGEVKANVFGIAYSQKVSGSRTVDGDKFSERAESVSVLVKAGLIKSYDGKDYTVSTGKYKKKKFEYGESQVLNYDDYLSAYGKPHIGLVKYELDGAVTHCAIDGDVVVIELEPVRATEFVRNEVRSTLGGKEYPKYDKVTIELRLDGEKPVSVTAKEKFRIDKFGETTCYAEYTETFDFGD